MRNQLARCGTWGQNKSNENERRLPAVRLSILENDVPVWNNRARVVSVMYPQSNNKAISNESQTKSKIIRLEWSIRSVDIIDSRISHYCTLVLIITYFHVYSRYKYVEHVVGIRPRYCVLASPSADELRLTPNRSPIVRVQSMYVRRTDNLSGLLPVSYSMVN